jgi:6-pyruvoyltetrahydropterin/6-carboxytetrahydropterin synthase
MSAEFEINLSKSYFKFNCSHFIAYRGYRERIHGHNYHISVKFTGSDTLSLNGYLLDFGEVKKVVKAICCDMDEFFLVPTKSDCLKISLDDLQLLMECEDGSIFSLPRTDCKLLPLVHTSSEELSRYLWCRVVRDIGLETLRCAGIQRIELSLCETEGQSATFRCDLPDELLALTGTPSGVSAGAPKLRGVASGLEEMLQSIDNGDDLSAVGTDKTDPRGLVLPELTYGDDDLAYMPSAGDTVLISK